MAKKLSEMTLEELWALFPIILKEHQSSWKDWYVEEEALLRENLPAEAVRISHIGSTAVETIWAKPIVVVQHHLRVAAHGHDVGRDLHNGVHALHTAAFGTESKHGIPSFRVEIDMRGAG